MGEQTKIQWATHTFNHVRGCQKIAQGCKFCYAEKLVNGRMQGDFSKQRVRLSDAGWKEPVKWNRDAALTTGDGPLFGKVDRPRVFCASLADIFEDWSGPIVDHKGEMLFHVPGVGYRPVSNAVLSDPMTSQLSMADLRRDLFALIDATPNLDWLLLTKRPENIRRMWPIRTIVPQFEVTKNLHKKDSRRHVRDRVVAHRPNVWLGVSVATQADADKNIPELLKCRDLSPVLFVSAEPLIEAVDFSEWFGTCYHDADDGDCVTGDVPYNHGIDWLICGGESGSNARPYDLAWPRSIIAQCKAAGVAPFHKQVGSNPVCSHYEYWSQRGTDQGSRDKTVSAEWIKHPKGGDPSEWEEDLRVREFPSMEASCRAT